MKWLQRQANPYRWTGDWSQLLDGDLAYSFGRSPATVVAAGVTLIFFIAAVFAPWVAPHDPFDIATLDLNDAFLPPVWQGETGSWTYPLGTDGQGRDVLSTIVYATRISLTVGVLAVLLAAVLGGGLGLLAGYVGGWFDALVMRLADIQLTIPAILAALMIDGIARLVLPAGDQDVLAIYVLILAIGISEWPGYARVIRGVVMAESGKDYVSAARVIGIHPVSIMLRHILPNVMGPMLVLASIGLALAIIAEATLSFLGVGVPPTTPSLGTLIRVGDDFLFSGEWWILLFPAFALVALVLAVNVLGDWMRDALDPKLR
jgi:peptide/nickel transport system permease protein